jgi:uncharacterized membrane protein YdbT with pleckstrin-like domain
MSKVLYEASPSMVRMNPIGTVAMFLLVLLGVAIAVGGAGLIGMLGFPLPEMDARIFGIAGIVLVVIGFVRLLLWWISTKVDHLKIKEDELIWTHGLLSKQFVEISLGSVRTVRVNQSILQRLMNAGDVTIFTSGDAPELVIRGLPEPDAIRHHVKGETGEPT